MGAIHHVVTDRCKGDGVCVDICNKSVIEIADGKARTLAGREGLCSACGQCVAVCPNEALTLEGASIGLLERRREWTIDWPTFEAFLLSRRSTRVFSEKPVERALIERVVAAAAISPPGMPPQTTEILVLDTKEENEHLAAALRAGYGELLELWSNPIARMVIRLRRGAELTHALKTHVIGIARHNNERFAKDGADRYLYGAPVTLLFHANRWSIAHQENALLAVCHAMLAAHALGLGATVLSIVPPIINNLGKGLREHLAIPEDHVVVTSMILGHPKYKYRRTIRREMKVRFASDEKRRAGEGGPAC